jgi:hypothetical protein
MSRYHFEATPFRDNSLAPKPPRSLPVLARLVIVLLIVPPRLTLCRPRSALGRERTADLALRLFPLPDR